MDFSDLRQIGGSSLTDAALPVREGDPIDGVVPTSYVPVSKRPHPRGRRVLGRGAGRGAIFVGAVWEDSSGYPDCRPEFYRAFEEVARLGTRPETSLRILTPLIDLSKAEIVRRGLDLGRALREDVVLLPGRGAGLRRVRVVPSAAAGLPGGGGQGPDSLSPVDLDMRH